ncbi:hypothetical protein X798_06720 [Onchocerca flexuosa]|uniref:Uncharacterized protein n=1 Tax=Onchocerca flexuosa TaxID=387005 RepID=A0A238BLH2_9BILA|nr:hypothetical protein X798_06720 [Onchocerca flexuosa]
MKCLLWNEVKDRKNRNLGNKFLYLSNTRKSISMEKGKGNCPEMNSISNCICNRSERTIICLTCGATFRGHAARACNEHPRRINLMDIQLCPNTSCRSKDIVEYENIDT